MRAGVIFLLAVGLLAGTAVADLTVVSEGARSGFDYGGSYVTEERAVFARSVVMHPGDRLSVAANLGTPYPRFDTYDLYVVNGGDRFALLTGEAPRVVYAQVLGMSTQSCCPNGSLVWDRIDDAFAHRDPAPTVAFGNSTEESHRAQRALLDAPERIDLVWVLHYRNESVKPVTLEAKARVQQEIEEAASRRLSFQPASDPGYPTVYAASVRVLHPALTWTMAALALVAMGSMLAWSMELRRTRVQSEGPGTESLLRLYDAAGGYLASLRDILIGSLVMVLAIALHVAVLGEPQPTLGHVQRSGIGAAASQALFFALLLAYASVVVVWGHAVWSVHRALRHWRARREDPPLDLP